MERTSAREYVRLNDRNHGVIRSTTRSNSISCFPTPKTNSPKSTNSQLGTPGVLIRGKDDFSTTNYDNRKNMEELAKLISQAQAQAKNQV